MKLQALPAEVDRDPEVVKLNSSRFDCIIELVDFVVCQEIAAMAENLVQPVS